MISTRARTVLLALGAVVGPCAGADRWRLQVAVGGAVGALVRTAAVLAGVRLVGGADGAVLVCNLAGAAALGWLVGRASHDPRWERWLPLLGTGLLGALTTFSTLADQVARALLAGRPLVALTSAAVSLAGGVAAARLGWRRGLAAPSASAGGRP